MKKLKNKMTREKRRNKTEMKTNQRKRTSDENGRNTIERRNKKRQFMNSPRITMQLRNHFSKNWSSNFLGINTKLIIPKDPNFLPTPKLKNLHDIVSSNQESHTNPHTAQQVSHSP